MYEGLIDTMRLAARQAKLAEDYLADPGFRSLLRTDPESALRRLEVGDGAVRSRRGESVWRRSIPRSWYLRTRPRTV